MGYHGNTKVATLVGRGILFVKRLVVTAEAAGRGWFVIHQMYSLLMLECTMDC